jgi:hypothetical protein
MLKTLGLVALASHGARGQTQRVANNNKYKVHIPAYNPAMNAPGMSYYKKNGSGGRAKHPGWSVRSGSHKRSRTKRKRI